MFIKGTEKNVISESVTEQPRVVLLILMEILLCYLQALDKREREKGCIKYS
jgi:hypothetical protein